MSKFQEKIINGFKWKEIKKDTWKDETSGLIWFPKENKKYTYDEALKEFNFKKRRIPTRKDFMEANRHGIREVLPNMKCWFWTSSPADDLDYFLVYHGDNGGLYHEYRHYYISVRCVGQDYSIIERIKIYISKMFM